MSNNKVLFSWLGNGDVRHTQKSDKLAGALAQTINKISPEKIYLLNGQDYHKTSWQESVENYLDKLRQKVGDENLIDKRIEDFNPIDYRQISHHVISFLDTYYQTTDETFFLQTSGTPSTAVVWILLSQTRFRAHLMQTSEENGAGIVDLPFNVFADFIPRKQDHVIAGIGTAEDFQTKIVHSDTNMKKVIDLANRVALHDIPVLLLGESGTGKELFAEQIHQNSKRKGDLVKINCGAIAPNLVESELFGHKKGAFTGANIDRKGAFWQANKGTLFLDEVGELTPEIQIKLLRVLQEGKISPLGSDDVQEINVRIIAATHRNLPQEVAKGRFREDLFYRLAVGVIKIPSLRARGNDVLLISEHILKETNEKFSKQIDHYTVKEFNKSAKDIITQEQWRGNVRELQNTIQRACIWNDTAELTGEHIKDAIIGIPDAQLHDSIMDRSIVEGFELATVIKEVEKHFIQRAFEMTAGNKSKMVRLLGSDRGTIGKKIKKYEIC